MNDDPSQPEDPAPTGHAAADSTPTDPPDPARSPGSGDRSTQPKLSTASLRHLTEVTETSRRIAARPPAVKLIGGTTLELLAQANKDQGRWAGLLAARQTAAKLHRDQSGINKFSQQLAQATAGTAGWRVALGRSDRLARAVACAGGWRIGPALDLKLDASFTKPLALKAIGGTNLGLLAPSAKGNPWAGLLGTGQAAAKLHGDLVGVSKLSERFAQAAGWRVGFGLNDRVARAVTGAVGWRIGPGLDLKLDASFTGPLALKVAGGSALALLARANKDQDRWAGLLSTGRAAKFPSGLVAATTLNEWFAQALLGHSRPVKIGLASEVNADQVISVVRREAERRAAAYQADTAVPQLLTLMEGQAQVLVGISEAIEELLSLARSSQVTQQAEATFNRRLQLAVLLATLAALLLTALSYVAPREVPPVSPAPQAPATTVTVPHAGVPTTTAPGPHGRRPTRNGRSGDGRGLLRRGVLAPCRPVFRLVDRAGEGGPTHCPQPPRWRGSFRAADGRCYVVDTCDGHRGPLEQARPLPRHQR